MKDENNPQLIKSFSVFRPARFFMKTTWFVYYECGKLFNVECINADLSFRILNIDEKSLKEEVTVIMENFELAHGLTNTSDNCPVLGSDNRDYPK